jgi:SAM-dependent methyltransferase
MRDFRLPEPVDLVLCEFDALNHVPAKGDLRRVAKSVARALRPRGHFYFDVNNRMAFEQAWAGGTWWMEKDDVAVVMHGAYDLRRDKGVTEVEWFIREGRCWRRHHERIEQVSWTPAGMRSTLRQAGFHRIRAWDAAPFCGPQSHVRPGHRTFYLAQKRGA